MATGGAHFQLALLSCLPKALRSPYVRLRGKGAHYDCEPPGPWQIRTMLKQSGFDYQDRCTEAVKLVGEIEGQSALNRIVGGLPNGLLWVFRPVYPTIMFLLFPKHGGHPDAFQREKPGSDTLP